jgi:hypothetical protein
VYNPIENTTIDLWLALALVTALSIVLFLLTCRLTNNLSKKAKLALAAVGTVTIVVFVSLLFDSHWLLAVLPLQAAIIYADLLLPLAAILAGVVWRTKRAAAWRRLLLIAVCVICASRFLFAALTVRTPDCVEAWDQNVCLQTSQSSCAAAAAATLLRYHGIDANEEQMAQLCLTSERGTRLHGLYRGLRIKTQTTHLRVVVRSTDLAHLRTNIAIPVILYVKLSQQVDEKDPRYSRDWGWRVGVTHTVVFFGFAENDLVDMGDPGVGREFWDTQALKDLWHGLYVTLEKSE